MKWKIALACFFVTACVSKPEKQTKLDINSEPPTEIKNDLVVSNEIETKTEITPDVLYLLMTAEIAGQRNQYGIALDAYLQAAKRANDARVSERAAKIGLYVKDQNKTDQAVNIWLNQDKDNLTARKIAVLSALREQNKDKALVHLDKLLDDDPASFEITLMELHKSLGQKSNPDFIFAVLEDMLPKHQDQAVIYFVQAILASQVKQFSLAKNKTYEALKRQPSWDKPLILKAQLSAQTNQLNTAISTLKNVLKSSPDNQRLKKMLGQILMKNKEYDKAFQLYEDLLKSEPEDSESDYAIAIMLLQQQKEDEAKTRLKRLVNKPKWNEQACFYLGRIEFKKKNYDEAIVWFDKVTQGPYEFDAIMASITVLMNQKKFDQTEQRLIDVSRKFPEQSTHISLLKAEIYNEQKHYQQAFQTLSDSLAQAPEHRDLLYSRALTAEKLDQLDILERDLKKILANNPKDAGALNALGYTLTDRTNRLKEAEVYLLEAISIQPDEAVILDSIGWLRYKMGNFPDALTYLRNAYQKLPESEIAAHLAEVLWAKGNKNEAKKVYDDAVKKAPDDEYLLKFKQRFLDSDE